jgi:hypothetical protein
VRRLTLILCSLLSGCTLTNAQLGTVYHATNAADVGTTLYGLDHGCQEGAPLLGGTDDKKIIVLAGLAASGLYEFVCRHAGDEERACRIGFLAVKLLAVGANAYTLSEGC